MAVSSDWVRAYAAIAQVIVSLATPLVLLILGYRINQNVEKSKLKHSKDNEWQVKWADKFLDAAEKLSECITDFAMSIMDETTETIRIQEEEEEENNPAADHPGTMVENSNMKKQSASLQNIYSNNSSGKRKRHHHHPNPNHVRKVITKLRRYRYEIKLYSTFASVRTKHMIVESLDNIFDFAESVNRKFRIMILLHNIDEFLTSRHGGGDDDDAAAAKIEQFIESAVYLGLEDTSLHTKLVNLQNQYMKQNDDCDHDDDDGRLSLKEKKKKNGDTMQIWMNRYSKDVAQSIDIDELLEYQKMFVNGSKQLHHEILTLNPDSALTVLANDTDDAQLKLGSNKRRRSDDVLRTKAPSSRFQQKRNIEQQKDPESALFIAEETERNKTTTTRPAMSPAATVTSSTNQSLNNNV